MFANTGMSEIKKLKKLKTSQTSVSSRSVTLAQTLGLAQQTYNVPASTHFLPLPDALPSKIYKHNQETSGADLLKIQSLEFEVLTSQDLRSIYRQLLMQPGLKALEALTAIKNNPAADIDTLLFIIISSREANDSQLAETLAKAAELKALEDADLDRAILVSEEDRDFEENRKRRRVADLMYSCCVPIASANEFLSSLLLKTSSTMHTDSSSSALPTIHTFQWKGSCGLLALTNYIQSNHEPSNIINLIDEDNSIGVNNCTCACSKDLQDLRSAIVRLLLVEKDALKFYGSLSNAYLQLLSEELDQYFLLLGSSPGLNEKKVKGSSSSGANVKKANKKKSKRLVTAPSTEEPSVAVAHTADINEEFIKGILQSSLMQLQQFIDSKTKTFQYDLYHLPKGSGGSGLEAPAAFRRAEKLLVSTGRMLPTFQIDRDGVEVLEHEDLDVKTGSWSEISDYESE